MCHIPPTLSVEELQYVQLLVELDPNITTIQLLALLQERKEPNETTTTSTTSTT